MSPFSPYREHDPRPLVDAERLGKLGVKLALRAAEELLREHDQQVPAPLLNQPRHGVVLKLGAGEEVPVLVAQPHPAVVLEVSPDPVRKVAVLAAGVGVEEEGVVAGEARALLEARDVAAGHAPG